MNKISSVLWIAIFSLSLGTVVHTHAYQDGKDETCASDGARYVFSWPIGDDCGDKPRGGSTRGGAVTLDTRPHGGWLAIQAKDLSKFERDRRAILAMAGPYKTTFDFLETVGFSEDYKRDRPYQSWGTEMVHVVEDKGTFISLQHIMVMYFVGDDGVVSAPMVMKHWRQDWTFQDKELLIFEHQNQWQKQKVSRRARKGTWSQAVFQVDDSPRYESMGRWQHNGSFSTWISETTRRPLPRREFSVRSDYQVLEGYNRHTITRTGWVQEEENWKMVVNPTGTVDQVQPYLSKEQGVARYWRIVDFDFSPGDQYMALAGQFWADVRREWALIFAARKMVKLHKKVDGVSLFQPLFQYAQEVMANGKYDVQAGREFAAKTIRAYLY